MKTPVLIAIAVVVALLAFGLYQGLVVAPTEQTMGDVQRIFYYHVPSAWTCFILFFINFVASIWYLFTRTSKADAIAVTMAEVGVVFWSVVIITGPLWAASVGYLVDLGRAPDVNFGARPDLRELSDSAALRHGRPDADPGCGAGCVRLRGRSFRLSLDLVFPHPASAAGDWGRWLAASRDVACV